MASDPGHPEILVPECCFCGEELTPQPDISPRFWGNNPEPLMRDDENRCCDHCNFTKVIPARIERYQR